MTNAICTVGLPGAGKGVVSDTLTEHDIPVLVMGDILKERAYEALGDNPSSSEIGEWAKQQRIEHGPTIVAQWTAEAVRAAETDTAVVGIDGMRSQDEYEEFTQHFDDVTVVQVTAPFETRLSRLRERGRDGEESFTATDLEDRDAREKNGLGLNSILESAELPHVTIENTGSIADLVDTLDDELSVALDTVPDMHTSSE